MSVTPLPDDLKALLLSVSVPTLSATTFKYGLQSRLLTGLKPLNPTQERFCGPAWTIRAIPVREDLVAEMAPLGREAFDRAPAGSVVVVASGYTPEIALIGDIMSTSLMVRGVAGAVLDTGVSDAQYVSRMKFPVVCAGSTPRPSSAKVIIVDFDVPVGISAVAIFPDDVIVGDSNGTVCIPRAIAEKIGKAAAEQEALEEFILERINAGATLEGTYPPSEATMAAYREWRAAKA